MDTNPAPLGVAAASPRPTPAWAEATAWVPTGPQRPLHLPVPPAPAWPRSAQVATVVLLVLALGLLAWHAYGLQRRGSRPTALEPDTLRTTRLDLNRADRVQLLQLPGVGEALAGRIESYRLEHGRYRSVEELFQVKGIGAATMVALRPLLYVEPVDDKGPEAAAVPAPPLQQPRAVAGRKKVLPARPVNVNTATAAELQQPPGIGAGYAAKILAARAVRPFRSVDELQRVKGIKAKRLEALRPYVTVGSAPKEVARKE